MHRDGLSYRLIGRNFGLFKNTVMETVRPETRLGEHTHLPTVEVVESLDEVLRASSPA